MYVCVRVLSEVRNCKSNTNRLVFDLDWFIYFILLRRNMFFFYLSNCKLDNIILYKYSSKCSLLFDDKKRISFHIVFLVI